MNMVKLIKVAESADPIYKSGDWDKWVVGGDNPDVSLPIEYSLKGTLIEQPSVGKSLLIMRTERNDVASIGVFQSSPVVEISASDKGRLRYIETKNSLYLLEDLVD
jgi:hypothetical protein